MFEKKKDGFFVITPKALKKRENNQNLTKEIKALEKRLKDIEERLKAGGL